MEFRFMFGKIYSKYINMNILSYAFHLEDSYEQLHTLNKASRIFLKDNYKILKNVLKSEPQFIQRLLDLPYKVIKSYQRYIVNKYYKIVLLGEPSVGKTSLLYKLLGNNINKSYIPTIGVDFGNFSIEFENQIISLQIWDTVNIY